MRGSLPKLSEEQAAQLVSLYQEGRSLNALAQQFGVNTVTVRNYLIRADVPRRNRGNWSHFMSDATRRQIARMYAQGLSQEIIAAEIHYSQTKVSTVLKAQGLRTDLDGERNHRWRGGRIVVEGYVKLRISALGPQDQALARATMRGDGAYIPEHRLVMARYLGRPLRDDETVHHIDDRDKQNNDISNLQLRVGRHGKGGAYRCAKCHSIDLQPLPLS